MVQRDDIQIRTPRAEDRDDVGRIFASSGFFSGEEVRAAVEAFDQAVQDPASRFRWIVAESSGRILGYACWAPIELTSSSFDLFWIAVDDTARGYGIGGLLLDAVEKRASEAGCTQLFIDTSGREQYAPTRTFYEHHGYERAAHIPDFYGPGDAKEIYVKRLGAHARQ